MLYVVLSLFILLTVVVVLARARAVNALTRLAAGSLILIPALPGDDRLEQRVKAFYAEQMFCDGRYMSEIIIVITDPSAADDARRLAEELEGVTAIELDGLQKYISDNYKEYKFKDS